MSGIENKLAGLTPEQRAFVELQLQRARTASAPPSIPRRSGDGPLPLSFAQQRLWLMSQLEPGSPAYVMPGSVRITGPLNLDALERALNAIVDRHESLRTTFVLNGEQPQQMVHAQAGVPVEFVDLSAIAPHAREAEARRIAVVRSREPFDLGQGPLVRAAVLRLDAADHVLVLSAHHIASDGWSLAIFVQEFGALYRAFDAGGRSPLSELPIQYADFAVWQRDWLQGERLTTQLDYWKTQLAGVPVLQLPTDRPRPTVPTSEGAVETLTLSPQVSAQLRTLTQAEGSTLFMTLLAGFAALLARYSGQDDIAIGSPIANRTRKELEGLIGCFVNTLVFRTDVSGDPTVRELLARMRQTALDAFGHQDLPFERLVDELQPERSVGQNPLFQVMFALQNAPGGTLDLGRVGLSAFDFPLTTTRFDLEMHVTERADAIALRACYRTDLFEAATIRSLLKHYAALLAAMAASPDARLSRVDMLSADERRALLAFNPEPSAYPSVESLAALFEAQVRRAPDARAVEYGDRTLTYRELNDAADAFAARLSDVGVGRGTLVGLLAERTPEMIVALVGILKAGGAYVPLDAAYPADRLEFMTRDAGIGVLVHHPHVLAGLGQDFHAGVQLIALDASTATASPKTAVHDSPAAATADDLAYVIYTSGSTGTPKGVAVPQRAVARLVCNTDYIQIAPGHRIAQASNASFDAATFEIWGALLHGATLVGIEKEVALSPAGLGRAIGERRLTALFLTTALFNQIAREQPAAFAPLDYLLFGGELVDAGSVATIMRAGAPKHLLHVYGPTESTTYATWHRVPAPPDAAGTVPIGRAIANTTAYIVDAAMRLVPPGVPGELFLGGDGLAHGYLNRPSLSAERFVPDPFGPAGARLYRTGDLVQWTADGRIVFLGRNDGQVKIRGFRIEIGEIETAVRAHPAVADTIVIPRVDGGDRRLVAYVVSRDQAIAWDELRAFLRQRLPDYMVPSVFVAMPELPLNANGKVDRGALPAPTDERQVQQALVLPRTELERRIADGWREVLRISDVGVADNFFDLGGHSLRLLQLHGVLVKSLGRDIPIVDLFRFPTIAGLASHLGDESGDRSTPRTASARRRSIAAAEREPIAIVGMAGRFPGAPDVETYWENLRNGIESIGHFSDEEVRAAGISEALIANPNFVRAFGVVEGYDMFDASFFGYSAREAAQMDPQHRHFLECAWEALERAGYDAQQYKGLIGIYAGCSPNLYLLSLLSSIGASAAGTMATFLGNVADYLPTRVAYKLNLRGPAVNVQSACSTSLVAVHHACQSLLNGECDMALAGGANIKRSMATGYLYEEGGILSPDGHCRAFDAKARGTVGGSGVGMVVLKLLADAVADGDTIHAIIRGTAINNDGSDKVGYTAPGVNGQAAVIRAAQAAAGVDARSIGYVEAHGTGTLLGDPIEIEALSQAFGGRDGQPTCAIGSVKSNIGHLDAAAGVAGLIKATLTLEHREFVPSLHFESPNPKMRLDETPFYVSTRRQAWPDGATPRRAGVSAFGIGGTNAHAIVEEAPAPEPTTESRASQLIVLSARSKPALDRATDNLAAHLARHPEVSLADMAFTLQGGRRRFRHRRMVVTDSLDDLRTVLASRDARRLVGADNTATSAPVAFVFPGQGAQAVNMGRGLYDTEPVFRAAVDRCADLLRRDLNGDLREVLYPASDSEAGTARMTQTAWSQPALFVVEYALAQLWNSWGVAAHAMIGHSLGEYVAACMAGVFTLEDALTLVAARGRMMQALPPGGMVAVPLDESAVRAMIGADLSIASVNGPSATVVSGPFAAIEAFERQAEAGGIAARRLVTSHAFHSAMLDPILAEFEALVRRLRPQAPALRFASNVTGTWITASEATDSQYWVKHLRGTVRFGDGLATLLEDGKNVPLEVGPGQGLTSLAKRMAGSGRDAVASLASRTGGAATDVRDIVDALGRLWLAGAAIDWSGFYANERRRRIVLPTYPFERQRYQMTGGATVPAPPASATAKRADVESWLYSPYWKRTPLDAATDTVTGCVLVLADADSAGDRLARRFPNAAVVRRSGVFAKIAEREYAVDPARREDFDAVFADLSSAQLQPVKIVHAWEWSDGDGEAAFASLLHLSQAAVRAGKQPVEISVVASGLHAVAAQDALAPNKALMIALGRVVSQEQPQVRFRTIDVANGTTDESIEAAMAGVSRELTTWTNEASVAYRGGERFVEAFDPVPPASYAARQMALRERGVYLITGGLGSIGLTMAEHLMKSVRAKVLLAGRSEMPAREHWDAMLGDAATPEWLRRRLQRLKQLTTLDGEVDVVRADVTNVDDLRAAIATAERRFGGLDGVIHGAVLSGAEVMRPVDLLSAADAARQLAPKVDATVLLEQALGDRKLDFCLLMSSLSAELGGIGFGAYAASNAFLDAFAHEHNRRGGAPWISINWDNWTQSDAASSPASGAASLAMTHEEGMQALDRVLRQLPTTRVLVSTSDLPARVRKFVGRVADSPDAAEAKPADRTPAADTARRHKDEWFYVPSWTRSIAPMPAAKLADSAPWLIFADESGFGLELGRRAAIAGGTAIIVRAGERFARTASGDFVIAAESADDYAQLLSELKNGPGLPKRIVHCWSLGDTARGDAVDSRAFLSLMYLARALSGQAFDWRLPLFAITACAQEVTGGESLQPEQALVTGPIKVLPFEDPRIATVQMDIDAQWAAASEPQWRAVFGELCGEAKDQSVAYRGAHRWVQRYEPAALPPPIAGAEAPLRRHGVYLITGGLGGIGLGIARHFARTLAARLVLTSRRAVPPRSEWAIYLQTAAADDRAARDIRAVQDLEALGAEVMVAAADAGDETAMRRVVDDATRRFGALHGVIHSAGVAGGGLIQLKTREMASRVLAPKTLGTRTLAGVLEGQRLDFFVLCSSLAALGGGFGQIDYCAANAYQDAFARDFARRTGVPMIAINWDTWRDAGMAIETDVPEALRARRAHAVRDGMSSEEGVEVFLRILGRTDVPQIAISTVSLEPRIRVPEPQKPAPADEAAPQEAAASGGGHTRPELGNDYVEPRTETERALCKVWEDVLGVSPIGVSDDFFELGGHSLLALQMLSRMRERLGVDIPIHAIFNAPTVGQLAELVKAGGAAAPEAAAPDLDRMEELLSIVEGLPEQG